MASQMKSAKGKGEKSSATIDVDVEPSRLAVQRASRATLEQVVLKALAAGTVSIADLGGPPPKKLKASSVVRKAVFTVNGTGSFDRLGVEETEMVMTALSLAERIAALSAVCKGWLALRRGPRLWGQLDLDQLGTLTVVGLMKLPRVVSVAETSRLKFIGGDVSSTSLTANDFKKFFGETPLPSLEHLYLSHKKLSDTVLTIIAKKSAQRLTTLDLGLSTKVRGDRRQAEKHTRAF